MEIEPDPIVPLLTTNLRLALAAGAASFLISVVETETINGELVSFVDYGALVFGGLTVVLALVSIRDALVPLPDRHKAIRWLVIAALGIAGLYRVAHGGGLLV